LLRGGLELEAAKNRGDLVMRMRSSHDTQVAVSAGGTRLGVAEIAAGPSCAEYRLPLTKDTWSGTIKDLRIDLSGPRGTTVAIDWIKVD
jgi:hypothetical protein